MERTPTDKRIDEVSHRIGRFEDRVGRFEDKVDARFERFEDKVDERFERFEDKVEARFNKGDADSNERSAASEAAIAALGGKMDKMNRWVLGGLGTIVTAVIIKVFAG
jgi:hypothetical protein